MPQRELKRAVEAIRWHHSFLGVSARVRQKLRMPFATQWSCKCGAHNHFREGGGKTLKKEATKLFCRKCGRRDEEATAWGCKCGAHTNINKTHCRGCHRNWETGEAQPQHQWVAEDGRPMQSKETQARKLPENFQMNSGSTSRASSSSDIGDVGTMNAMLQVMQ